MLARRRRAALEHGADLVVVHVSPDPEVEGQLLVLRKAANHAPCRLGVAPVGRDEGRRLSACFRSRRLAERPDRGDLAPPVIAEEVERDAVEPGARGPPGRLLQRAEERLLNEVFGLVPRARLPEEGEQLRAPRLGIEATPLGRGLAAVLTPGSRHRHRL